MEFFVHIDGERLKVKVENGRCLVEGEEVDVAIAPGNGTPVRSASAGGRSLRVRPRRKGKGDWRLDVEGTQYRALVLDPGQEAIRKARQAAGVSSGPAPLRAPMPGMVVRIEVAEGDEVDAGDGVVIVEAMKMENELRAPAPARVRSIAVEEGMAVDKDQVLVEFEPLEADAEAGSLEAEAGAEEREAT